MRLRPPAHLLPAGAAPHAGSGSAGAAQRSCACGLQPGWRSLASITGSPDAPGSSSGSPGLPGRAPEAGARDTRVRACSPHQRSRSRPLRTGCARRREEAEKHQVAGEQSCWIWLWRVPLCLWPRRPSFGRPSPSSLRSPRPSAVWMRADGARAVGAPGLVCSPPDRVAQDGRRLVVRTLRDFTGHGEAAVSGAMADGLLPASPQGR